MSVFETMADLVQQIRDADQQAQGEWSVGNVLVAFMDEDDADCIIVAARLTDGFSFGSEWLTHPAVLADLTCGYIGLSSWALDDGALEAVVAAEVNADYARAAHRAGVTDAWQLIDAWRNGILVEFLSALGGEA